MRLVFVSSTFKDMQFERDELSIRLAPRINDFLAKYGESVRFGDLRWGVNTSELESEESSKKVLKVCLDEIDNAKPYMIVFVGERYGWIPSSSLLDEAMKMKDITNVPNDISVTNLEIEYGALLNPDYEGRILFYFRRPFDTSKMSEEERKIYESESPLHKEKLEALKEKILKLYPEYVRYYDVEYDQEKKCLIGLDKLMDTIYSDLTRIFDIDYKYLNSLPKYQRAIINSEVYFESFFKYAFFRKNLKDPVNHKSEFKENYDAARYEDIPCLRYVLGEPGSGRKTTIACLYKLAKDKNPNYVLPFVFGLDEFTHDRQALIDTLISFYEEKLNYRNLKSKNILTLVDLIKYNDEHKKHHFQIFIMNHDRSIITFLKELEFYVKEMFHTTFYVMSDRSDKWYSPYLCFAFHSDAIVLEELTEKEKIAIINKICESKHKELSSIVVNEILRKENSGSPLYLSLVVERLLMLDNEDFQNIRNLGDGMSAINEYMISIVKNLGNDIHSITKELFKELAERINYDTVMHILYLAANDCGLHINEYCDFFFKCNIAFKELDASLLYNMIPSLFRPVSIYNAIDFAFEEGKKAALELVDNYIKEDFYMEYVNYLDDSVPSLIKKMSILREHNNLEQFYITYTKFIASANIDQNRLIDKAFTQIMDLISNILFGDDDFKENFIIYCLEQILEHDDKHKGKLLSTIFYPYFMNVTTDNDKEDCVNIFYRISKYLKQKIKTKKYQNNEYLHLICKLASYINNSIIDGEYINPLDDDLMDGFKEVAAEVENFYDNDIALKALSEDNVYSVYYNLFNKRALLAHALEYFDNQDEYELFENYYKQFVLDNLQLDKLNSALINDDFSSWYSNNLIDSVISLFYSLIVTKYEESEELYFQRLNHFLKVGELVLQNDFLNLDRCSFYELYFVEPLFSIFSTLVELENIDETIQYNLRDWILFRGRLYCAENPTNIGYLTAYASAIYNRDICEIPNEDFFFIYPLLYRYLTNDYQNTLWDYTISLVIHNQTLYKSETDEEFIYLSEMRFNLGDREQVFMRLVSYLYYWDRDLQNDYLIGTLYAYLYSDYDYENQKEYKKWMKDYLALANTVKE